MFPYTVNGREHLLSRGSAIHAPAGALRQWTIPEGRGVDASWFRYACQPDEPNMDEAMVGRVASIDLEDAAIARLRGLFSSVHPADMVAAEGEAKAIFSRVIPRLKLAYRQAAGANEPSPRRGDIAVNRAVRYLDVSYQQRDALERMTRQTPMSPSYFRKLFRAQVGLSPQAFLTRRRLQQARYLLRTAELSVKDVADQVGYDDPLYFSRAYARFWGRPPSGDQTASWSENDR